MSTKNVSVDKPDIKRLTENKTTLLTNADRKSPKPPQKVLKQMAGKRPIRSARKPKDMVPKTAPK